MHSPSIYLDVANALATSVTGHVASDHRRDSVRLSGDSCSIPPQRMQPSLGLRSFHLARFATASSSAMAEPAKLSLTSDGTPGIDCNICNRERASGAAFKNSSIDFCGASRVTITC